MQGGECGDSHWRVANEGGKIGWGGIQGLIEANLGVNEGLSYMWRKWSGLSLVIKLCGGGQ